jgi:uncharacterized membrane protein
MRKCQFDQLPAKYVCKTHNAYFCAEHSAEHISDGKPHISVKIDNALNHQDYERLQKEVNERIKALECAKQQVASKAAQLIANIEQALISSIKNLNKEIQCYRACITDSNFKQETLQNIAKILATRLEISIDQQLTVDILELTLKPDREEEKRPIENKEQEELKQQPQKISSNHIKRKFSKS